MEHVNSDAYKFYYRYLNHLYNRKPDENLFNIIHPQNGWELISANRGWYPDNSTIFPFSASPTLRSVPYLLFYNKYTAMARIYVRYGNNEPVGLGANYADITISHQDANAASGMLRLANGKDITLDKPTTIAVVRTRVPSPSDAQLWFSADFQMHYDPCVCQHKSTISVDFDFYNIASLKLYGRSVTLEGDITDENIINEGSNFLDFRGTYDASTSQPTEGYIIYNHYIDLIDDYLKKLKAYKEELLLVNLHNQRLEKDIQQLEQAKVILSTFGSIAEIFSAGKAQKVIKAVNKIISGGFDFAIKSQPKKLDKPTPPKPPTAAISEMSFSGSWENGTPKNGPIINTPGSKDAHVISASNKPHEFPIYNEALGVFALLETPKIYISENQIHMPNAPEMEFECGTNWPIFYGTNQWQLNEPLKYAINPALKISNLEILASIEVDVEFNENDGGCGHIFNRPNMSANIITDNFELDANSDFLKNGEIYSTNFTLSSIYVPIDALNDLISSYSWGQRVFGTIYDNTLYYSADIIKSARLKLIIDVEYDGVELNGNAPQYTYFHTYDIDLNDSQNIEDISSQTPTPSVTYIQNNFIYENIVGSTNDYTLYEEDLEFEDIVFSGQQVEGCVKIGNHYTCKAYNNILLSGLISTLAPMSVEFIAGNEIIVEPESDINTSSGDIVLRIEPVLIMSPMPPQDHITVSAWCNSTKYKANTLRSDIAAIQDSLAQANPAPQPEPALIEFIVFPNPTTGTSQAGLNLPELATVSISIVDITGKVQGRPVQNPVVPMGRHVLTIASEPLAPGVYFVQVVVNGEKLTQRHVKQ